MIIIYMYTQQSCTYKNLSRAAQELWKQKIPDQTTKTRCWTVKNITHRLGLDDSN